MRHPRPQQGLTRVELAFAACAIVAALAAVAIPRQAAQRARVSRAEARSALLAAGAWMRQQAAHGGAAIADDAFQAGYPSSSHPDTAVRAAGGPSYRLRVVQTTDAGGNVTGYTLVAMPAANGPMADDKDCLGLAIDDHGVQGARAAVAGTGAATALVAGTLDTSSATVAECWAS